MADSCLSYIAKTLKDLTPNELEDIATALKDGSASELRDKKIASLQEVKARKYAAALNAVKFKENMRIVGEFKLNGRKSAGLGVRSRISGVQSNIKGAKLSAEGAQKATTRLFLGRFLTRIKSISPTAFTELLEQTRDRDILNKIMFPDSEADGTTSSIARAISDSFEETRRMLNSEGAWIPKREGYTGKVSHDVHAMLSATGSVSGDVKFRANAILDKNIKDLSGFIRDTAKNRWTNYILPMLDAEKTFGSASPQQFLGDIYDALVSGHHTSPYTEDSISSLRGGANIAKKVSAERSLIFKRNPDNVLSYMKSYGHGSLLGTIKYSLEVAGSKYGLMSVLGTKPIEMFEKMEFAAKNMYKLEKGLDSSLRQTRTILGSMMNEYSAGNYTPVGRIVSGINSMLSMAALGGAGIKAIPDLEIRASKMTEYGISRFETYTGMLRTLFDKDRKGQNKWIADSLNAWASSALADYNAKGTSADTPVKAIASLQRLFYKFNGLHGLDNINRAGAAGQISRALGKLKSSAFSELPAAINRNLSNYGITDKDWDLIRKQSIGVKTIGHMVGPDLIDLASKEDVASAIGKDTASMSSAEEEAYRQKALLKWATYFTGEIDDAQIQPTYATRAFWIGRNQSDTAMGIVSRMFGMFKYFGTEVVKKTLGRIVYGNGASSLRDSIMRGDGSTSQLLYFMMNTVALSYIATSAAAIAKGETPPKINDPKTLKKIFLESGAFGYAASLAGGQYDEFQNSFIDALAGPMGSAINKVARMETIATSGGPRRGKKLLSAGESLAEQFIPGQNLPYIKTPLNYLLLYHWHEANDPGYIHRLQGNLKKNAGQELLFNPQ